MHYIYDSTDGNRLISIASALPGLQSDGLKSVWLEGKGVWNRETVSLDPLPVRRRVTKADFGALLTDAELAGLFTLESTDQNVAIFLRRLEFFGHVDLADSAAGAFIQHLVNRGVLTENRAAEISG